MARPPEPRLEWVFHVEAELGELIDFGRTRAGHLRSVAITGGRVTGRIEGVLDAGGADWQVVHDDGRVDVDARYSATDAAGNRVAIHAHGVRTGGAAALAALLRGEDLPPEQYYFRTHLELDAAPGVLGELGERLLVAVAARRPDRVDYDAYLLG